MIQISFLTDDFQSSNKTMDFQSIVIYFNNKDPRVIVRNINSSMGWTLDFANPLTYLYLFGAIGLILAINY